MQNKIAFIACSKSKRTTPCRARDMYTGALFRKALKYTECRFEKVLILSALYGVVDLNQIITPYERTLNTMPLKERKEWAAGVWEQIKKRKIEKKELWFFTGYKYHEFFKGQKPLQGLSLGYQLQWFDQQSRLNIFKNE